MSEDSSEKVYSYKNAEIEDVGKPLFPTTTEQAPAAGKKYYEHWLKPILPGLLRQVQELEKESGVGDEETACIFLDRDARPAMYAWNEVVNSRYISFPMPVSSIQFGLFVDEYANFVDSHWGEIGDPNEWSGKLTEEFDKSLSYNQDIQKWIDAFRNVHASKLGESKLVTVVDIGYRGSTVEIARYLLQKAFPDKIVKTILLYKYSDDIPIRAVQTGETWYAEETIPHTTKGYALDDKHHTYRHIKGREIPRHEVEQAFYRGVIDGAKKDKQTVDTKKQEGI